MKLTPVTYLASKPPYLKLPKPFSFFQPPFSPNHFIYWFSDFGFSFISKPNWSADKPKLLSDKPNWSANKPKLFFAKPNWSAHKPKSSSHKPKSFADKPALLNEKLFPVFQFVASFSHWLAGPLPADLTFGRFRGKQPLTTACAVTEAVRP